jgi:hypothetical protein
MEAWAVNSWFIVDTQGKAVARWGVPSLEFLGKEYAWRDYFLGARGLAPQRPCAAYVSRAFKSESDELFRFAISAPIHDEQGQWLGVIIGMVDTGSTLGSLRLNEMSAARRTAMLEAARSQRSASCCEQLRLPEPWPNFTIARSPEPLSAAASGWTGSAPPAPIACRSPARAR